MIRPEDWRGLRIAIVGAAREGVAAARYLAANGAQVTLYDAKPLAALSARLVALEGLDVVVRPESPQPELGEVDVVFLSPGVPPSAAVVRAARERGLPLSSEPRLFVQSCPAPVVGITGSSGKSTTTTLVGQMLSASGRCTWVGGNIGLPLTERLLEPERPAWAVMELSSFQLELFSPAYQGQDIEQRRSEASRLISLEGWSPHVAAVTNVTPNHLDRHPTMADYVEAKRQILAYQQPEDWVVLNADDEICRAYAAQTPAKHLWFSLEHHVEAGAYLRADKLVVCREGREEVCCHADEVKLRGRHNLANTLTALCCAQAAGVGLEAMRAAATTFTGVSHRLEMVRRLDGVTFVNDSIATSPERSMAALRSFGEPLVLLAGGRDKHLDWSAWADLVVERVRVLVAFGDAVPIITAALEAAGRRCGAGREALPVLHAVPDLDTAVQTAVALARAGDVVLLSPGGTSFDAFEDFEARGRRFCELIAAL